MCEALLALRPDVRAVWLFKDPRKARPHMPERVRAVRSHSLAGGVAYGYRRDLGV